MREKLYQNNAEKNEILVDPKVSAHMTSGSKRKSIGVRYLIPVADRNRQRGQCVGRSRVTWSQNRLTFLVFVCARRRLEKHFWVAPRAEAWGGGRAGDTASVGGLAAGAGVALATRPKGASQIGRKHDRTLLLPTRNRPFLLPIKHKVF